MVDEGGDSEAVFEVLCSGHAREILVATESGPRSAKDLAEHCDTSLPTIYRRLNSLVEQGLLEEQLKVDPDGNHHKMYISSLNFIRLETTQSGFTASVRLKQDIVDQFGEFWQTLGAYSNQDADR